MLPSRGLFRETQRLLTERAIVIAKARYDRECFGSWEVCVAATPQLRVLFDGKDGWLFVQRLIQGPPHGQVWEEIWTERQPSNGTPAQAVDKLAQLLA